MDKDFLAGFVVDLLDRWAVDEITKDIDLFLPTIKDGKATYQKLKETTEHDTTKERAFIKCYDSLKAAFETGDISPAARVEIFDLLDKISSGLIL